MSEELEDLNQYLEVGAYEEALTSLMKLRAMISHTSRATCREKREA